jgi:thiamine biosynthesis lipoprotein
LEKKASFLFLIFLFLFNLIFYVACRPAARWHSLSLLFFDTACDLKIYGTEEEFISTVTTVRNIFTRTEELFSPQAEDYSSEEVRQLFRLARKIHLDSGGAFDLTVGILAEIWGFRSKSYRVPEKGEISRALNFIGLEKIVEKEDRLIVPGGVIIDWGGLAKGWALDQAFQALQKAGISRGFINAGGDLICFGKNPDNQAWRIGIKHPRESGFLGVLEISDLAVATSGDYQRYFEIKGVRYHHIFDPRTGFPACGKQSVTVIGPQATICDALATALFVLKDASKLLSLYPDYGVIIVDDQGSLSFAGKTFPFTPLK